VSGIATNRLAADLAAAARIFPDFPRPGIQFRDLHPVFADPALVRRIGEAMTAEFDGLFDRVLAVEARGFVLGTAVALVSGRPLVLARKAGKLPGPVYRTDYALEYGSATLEVQCDAVRAGERVLAVDDILATGGTLEAAGRLVTACGGEMAGYAVISRIEGVPVTASLEGARLFVLA
jgi:adenine phosphoribosyltransferase